QFVEPFEPPFGKACDVGQLGQLCAALADPLPGSPGALEKHVSPKLLANACLALAQVGDFVLKFVAATAPLCVPLLAAFERTLMPQKLVPTLEKLHERP